jgi:hypothetical protein
MAPKMKVVFKREAGGAFTMGMFANAMQVGMLLQPTTKRSSIHCESTQQRPLQALHRRRATQAEEVAIVVDAATKAVPLLKLMELAQTDAAAALVDETAQPPYSPGVPALESLAGSFLPAPTRTPEEKAALEVHRKKAREEARKASSEKAKEKWDDRTEKKKAADSEKGKEKRDGRTEKKKAADSEKAKEKWDGRGRPEEKEKKTADIEKAKEKWNGGRTEKKKKKKAADSKTRAARRGRRSG